MTVTADTAIFTDYAFTQRWSVWHEAVRTAQDSRVISAQEAASHLEELVRRASGGRHMLALTILITAATKP